MKRVLSLVLAFSMVLSMFSFAFAGSGLKDIDGTEYEAAVSALVELGIVNGYTDGTFLPEKVVSRAEMAKLLVVAAGLEPAADVAKGATRFSDVAGDHWASGYINVAAEYGYIVGYPDGTFQPEATVTYAEAVTMAIRVLGYRTVVEAKGTWPTNYIAKATELKILNEIKYGSYADGAKRGNVAKLIWNALRAPMWDVLSENETNGLTYGKTGNDGTQITMIDKYFEDYDYLDEDDEAILVGITVADDGEVTATLGHYNDDDRLINDYTDYELVGGDLVRMIAGMRVQSLVDTKEKKILTLIPSDAMVEGRIDEDGKLEGKEYTYDGNNVPEEDDYVVAIPDGKVVGDQFIILEELNPEELDADEIEDLIEDDEDLEVLYVLGSQWLTAKDLEEGDVVTLIENKGAVTGKFYAVARNQVEGTYNGFVTEKDGDKFVKVNKESYSVDNIQKYYKYSESKEKNVEITEAEISKKDNGYLDEDVRLVLDYVGNVVNVYFSEPADVASNLAWYIMSGNMWSETGKSGVKYYATLSNTDLVEDDFEIDPDDMPAVGGVFQATQGVNDLLKELTAALRENGGEEVPEEYLLELVMPMFEKNGKLRFAEDFEDEWDALEGSIMEGGYLFGTDEDDALPEYCLLELDVDNGDILDSTQDNYLVNGSKVTSGTVVITIRPVIDDDEVTELKLTASTGTDELKGVKNALVVAETTTDTVDGEEVVTGVKTRANYVFVADVGTSSDLSFGKVTSEQYSNTSRKYIEIDGEDYELAADTNAAEGDYVAWSTKDDKITVKAVLRVSDLKDEAVVTNVDDELITLEGAHIPAALVEIVGDTERSQAGIIDIDNDEDAFKDVRFVLVNATRTKDGEDYKVKFGTYKDLGEGIKTDMFEEYDRVQMGVIDGRDVIIVIVRSSSFKEDTVLDAGIFTDNH